MGVESKTWSKNSVLAFLKCMDGSVLAFLKCTDGSVLVFPKCMDGSLLAHLRFPMQSAPTIFPQSGNSKVPQLLCKKSTKMSYLKQNVKSTPRVYCVIYPNNQQKLTGCQYDSLQLQIALAPKRAGLVWTVFFTESQCDVNYFSVLKSPHKSSLFRPESNQKTKLFVD